MTARYWCERAWLGGPRTETGVLIEVDRDRIAGVAAGVCTRPEDAVPLAGLTLPALANAHSHAFHRALRGRTHSGRGNFWTWRDLMYRAAARLDPDNYYRLARAVFAEMALAGIGTVGEFHYVHHRPDGSVYDDPNAMGAAVVSAARDAGVRLTLLDTLYLHGGLDAGTARDHGPLRPDSSSGYSPLKPEQARFSDGSAERWAERVDSMAAAVSAPAVRVGAAVHSVRAVDPASIKVAADWAQDRDAPLHFHASEQPAENEQCLAVHGRTPVEVIAEAGGLGSRHVAGPRDPRHRARPRPHRRGGSPLLLLPDHRARSRRRGGAGRGAGPDRRPAVRGLGFARRGRPVRGGQSGRARPAGPPPVTGACSRWRSWPPWPPPPATGPSAGPTAAPWRRARWPTSPPLASTRFRLAGIDDDSALAAVIFAATAADVRHLVVGGRAIVRGGAHTSINAASELRAAIHEVVS